MSILDKKLTTLLADDSFVSWIKGKATEEEQRRWDEWEQSHPLHTELKRRACLMYGIPMGGEDSNDLDQQLHKLNQRIDRKKKAYGYPSQRRSYPLLAAAVILLLVGVVSFISFSFEFDRGEVDKRVFKTIEVGDGESAVLSINDGSEIHLNANSTLKYKPGEFNKGDVDVWLDGEAYFSITHNPNGKERVFTVHTPDGEVQELGTKFNVNTRFFGTSIVLVEGKVKLILRGHNKKARKETFMKPGEKAVLDSSKYSISIENVDPALYTAWIEGKMEFHNTSLKEIIKTVEVTYGVAITVADSALLNKKVSGALGNPNLEVLVDGLERSLDLSFEQKSENMFLISE